MAGSRSDIKAGAAFVELFTKDAALVKGLQSAQKRLTAFGGQVKSIGTTLSWAGAAITTPFAGLLGWGVKLSAEAEQASVAFGVLLGSETKAKEMLAEIKKFANTTPFDEAGLKSAAQLLLNFGITGEGVMPTLRMLGDVAGGDAEKLSHLALAFGQMSSTGRLMGQDLNQMINAGFNPLQEISRTTGKSMAELKTKMEAGGISVGMVTDAFASATGKGGRFFGMMDKQSKTLTGVWSTMKDALAGVLLSLADPLLPLLKQAATFTTGLLEAVKKLNAQSGMLTKIVFGVAAAGAGLTVLGGTLMAIGPIVSTLGTILGGIATFGTLLAPIAAPLAVLAGIVGGITVALGAGVFAWAKYTETGRNAVAWLGGQLSELLAFARTTIGGIGDALMGGDLGLAASIGWAAVMVVYEKGKLEIFKILRDLRVGFAAAFGYVSGIASSLIDQLVPNWRMFASIAEVTWNSFKKTALIAFDAITIAVNTLINRLKGFLIALNFAVAETAKLAGKPVVQGEINRQLKNLTGVDAGKSAKSGAGAGTAAGVAAAKSGADAIAIQTEAVRKAEEELARLMAEAAALRDKAGPAGAPGKLPPAAAAAVAAKASSFGSFSGAALGANSQGSFAPLVAVGKSQLKKLDEMIDTTKKLALAMTVS